MPPTTPRSPRIRRQGSLPRRRRSDPLPRRRENDHAPGRTPFGAFLTVLIAVMFLGYVFNLGGFATAADHFFSGLNASAQGENDRVVRVMSLVYPAVGLLVAALVLFGLLHALLNRVKPSSVDRRLAGQAAPSEKQHPLVD